MQNTAQIPTADEIADMAERGEDISQYFTNQGVMKYPSQQVMFDLPSNMLLELDELAQELNMNVQAVITTYLRQALDQHYLARRSMRNVVK